MCILNVKLKWAIMWKVLRIVSAIQLSWKLLVQCEVVVMVVMMVVIVAVSGVGVAGCVSDGDGVATIRTHDNQTTANWENLSP